MKSTGPSHQTTYTLKPLKVMALLVAAPMFYVLFCGNRVSAAAPSASIGSTSGSISTTVTPDAGPGANAADTVRYSTTCKNESGKAVIYVSTESGKSALAGADGANIPASATTTTDATSSAPAPLAQDTWGFNLTGSTDAYFGFDVSGGKTKIASLDAKADGSASGSTTIYYNANISGTTLAGDYSTTVIYTTTLDAACSSYMVYYEGNNNTGGAVPTFETYSWSDTESRTLAEAGTLTRVGYTFKGWAKSESATTPEFDAGGSYTDTQLNPEGKANITLYAVWEANLYTCAKQYRLEDANGNWGPYQSASTEEVAYGETCNYSQSVTNYKSQTGANNSAATASGIMSVDGITLQVSLYRNTYTLTVNRNTAYISNATGGGTYRWGQTVNITATPSSGNIFTNWTLTSGSGTIASSTSASTSFTMSTSNATVQANGVKAFWDIISNSYKACGSTMQDNRDGTTRSYSTAEINGLCWMTTNLALGKSTTTTLTSSNTNIASNYVLPASSTSGFGYSNTTTANIYNSGSTGYYNWPAATAGTNPSSGDSTYDICPKNWRLPTRTEFQTLIGVYNTSAKLTSPPFNAIYAGYYNNNLLFGNGTRADFWSSTADSNTNAYRMHVDSSNDVGVTTNGNGKSSGFSIRCVAK